MRRFIVILLAISMVFTFAGCAVNPNVTGTTDAASTTAVTTIPGAKADSANYVYCTGEYLYKVNTETGEKIKIPNTGDFQVRRPIVYKGFVYYVYSKDRQLNFCRIKTDGTQKHTYKGVIADDFHILNDKIYFATVKSRYGPSSDLYRMNLDGTDLVKLAESLPVVSGFEIFKDKIYTSYTVMDLNGKKIKDLPEFYGVTDMKANDDVIIWWTAYSTDNTTSTRIYEYNIKTGEVYSKADSANKYDVADGYYVYFNGKEKELRIVDTKNNTDKLLIKVPGYVETVLIRNDIIYYQIVKSGYDRDGDYYCVNKDGSGNKKIYGVSEGEGGYWLEVDVKD